MAELNPKIESTPKDSMTYELYQKFVDSFERANKAEAPDFTNPPMKLNEDGSQAYDPNDPVVPLVDVDEINRRVQEHAEIQAKNYAFDLADAIASAAGGSGSGGEGSGNGFLPLAGGSMTGRLTAKYGVELGDNGNTLIRLGHTGNGNPIGYFDLSMQIGGDVAATGKLELADVGIWFNRHQSIFIADQTLNIDYQKLKFTGDTDITGVLTIGGLRLDGASGIRFDGNEFYHVGNSNNSDIDWSAKNLIVYGDATINGKTTLSDRLIALKGFDLGESGNKVLYSTDDGTKTHVNLSSDLTILGLENGIRFDEHYIIKTRSASNDAISFSAPGHIMNLGDSDDGVATKSIALQSNFNTANNAITLITPQGAGLFLGLTAHTSASGNKVLETYFTDSIEQGVLFQHNATFGSKIGPTISSEHAENLTFGIPYFTDNESVGISAQKYHFSVNMAPTESLWLQNHGGVPTVEFATDTHFFRFSKPVEAQYFSVISRQYQTKLDEGALFLDKNLLIEAIGETTLHHTGNSTFDGDLSSPIFTSGFSGSGWGILKDGLTGSYGATFDELTVRKKSRFYELEVQKINITNGSWWVSDVCSGDIVEEV